jgi:hypothetical protein
MMVEVFVRVLVLAASLKSSWANLLLVRDTTRSINCHDVAKVFADKLMQRQGYQ